jgi:hypothetical protein
MSAESDRFRKRATMCRELAHAARDDASDLDAEAELMDAEETSKEFREG